MMKDAIAFIKKLKSGETLITFHSLADLDCIGSAFALKKVIPGASIVAPNSITGLAKRAMKSLGLKFDQPKANIRNVIVLDTHSKALLPHCETRGKNVLVIDHHSLHTDKIPDSAEWIDKEYISTSEMILDLLQELKVKIDPKIAAMLFYGLVSDSAEFRSANVQLFRHAAILLEKSHEKYNKLLSEISDEENLGERIEHLRASQSLNYKRINQYLIVWTKAKSFESSVAIALENLGADVAIVGVETGKDARISARARNHLKANINLGEVMKMAGKILGGSGGGHEQAAGAWGKKSGELNRAMAESIRLVSEQLRF